MPGATPGEGGSGGKAGWERGLRSCPQKGAWDSVPAAAAAPNALPTPSATPTPPAPSCGVSRSAGARGGAFLLRVLGRAAHPAPRGPPLPPHRGREPEGAGAGAYRLRRAPRPRPVAGSGVCGVWGGGGGGGTAGTAHHARIPFSPLASLLARSSISGGHSNP